MQLAVDVGQVDVDDACFGHLAFIHVEHFLLGNRCVVHPLDGHVAELLCAWGVVIGIVPCVCHHRVAPDVVAVGEGIEQHEGASQIGDALAHGIIGCCRFGIGEDELVLHVLLVGVDDAFDTVAQVAWQHVHILLKCNEPCLHLLLHLADFLDALAALVALDGVILFHGCQLCGDGHRFSAVHGEVDDVPSNLQGVELGRFRRSCRLEGE